jgi:diguanylate cyclase (GGDEF)-like protein
VRSRLFSIAALLRILAAFLLAGVIVPSAGEAAKGENKLTPCVRAVAASDTVEQIAAMRSGFDCKSIQRTLPSGDYWVRLDTKGAKGSLSDPLKLRMASLWHDSQNVHIFYADGKHHQLNVPPERTSDYIMLGARLEFPLAISDQPIDQIIVRVGNSPNIRGIMLAPELVTTSESARDERDLAALYAAFAGLCIALLVYNLALWRGMRSPFQLAYGAMVVALLAYAFTSSGAAAYVFPKLENHERLRLNYVFLASSAATALVFLRHFVEPHVMPRWLVRLCWIQASAVMATSAAFAILAPQWIRALDMLYFFSFLPLPVFFIVSVFYSWRRKSHYTGYLFLAWSAPVIVAFARSLHGMGLVPYSFLLDNGSLIAMALEAMISSMAIGQRVRRIARERDGAQQSAEIASALADRDPLTGLLNRRAFVRKLLDEAREWQLVLVDIDHFKRVNDTLGHVDGDTVLVNVAKALQEGCAGGALVARLGGEEFAIATPLNAAAEEMVNPTALLKAIRDTEMPGNYRVTASIGVARRAICEEQDWIILYRAADMALYRAKADGRDRHVDYSDKRVAA